MAKKNYLPKKKSKVTYKPKTQDKKKPLKSNFKKTNYIAEHAKLISKRDSLKKIIADPNSKKKNRAKVQLANTNIAINDLNYWQEKHSEKKKHYTDRKRPAKKQSGDKINWLNK